MFIACVGSVHVLLRAAKTRALPTGVGGPMPLVPLARTSRNPWTVRWMEGALQTKPEMDESL